MTFLSHNILASAGVNMCYTTHFLTTHRHVGKYWDRINLTDDWVYYRSFLSVPDQPQFTVCLSIVI